MNITATITAASIKIEVTDVDGMGILAVETRPATLADADSFLAANGFARTTEWDLHPTGMQAAIAKVDNKFNNTRAARLAEAVGTTHYEWLVMQAEEARNGDLISDLDLSAAYVVAACSTHGSITRICMVAENKTWEDRNVSFFPSHQLVQVARRKM